MELYDQNKILIVDDEADIREVLRLLLESEGYAVVEADSGADALAKLDSAIGLIILDVRMPVMNGYEVCERVRAVNTDVMILFLTAKDQEADRVYGLRRGGDDYLGKPFSPSELSARVDALLRRYRRSPEPPQAQVFRRGELLIDFSAGIVAHSSEQVSLTELEYRLLAYLAEHAGETIDARRLYEAVWHERYLPVSAGTIMVHIGNLRRKLETDPKQPTLIKTVWGKGYRID
ncbi:DNA-binding response regulator [Clostridia bacterium]|nr:DNA-binding response regulator [Clostridia bacterium]